MRNISRSTILSLAIAVLLALPFLFLGWHKSQSERSLQFWLARLGPDKPNDLRQQAEQVILQLGTNALPPLVQMISSKDLRVKRGVVELVQKWYHYYALRGLVETAYERRQLAVRGFRVLGEKADPAIPAITNLLVDSDLREDACAVLATMGPKGIDVITRMLMNQNENARYRIIYSVCGTTVSSEALDRALLTCLSDTDINVVQATKWALGKDGRKAEAMVPLLAADLQSVDVSERIAAARALGNYKECTLLAITALNSALNDEELVVRQSASNALQSIDCIMPRK